MVNQLVANNLAKTYKKRRVVDHISLQLQGGEIVGLLGPNGAGKTTSFYMIVGLVPSDEGQIRLNNQDITLMPMHARARLGISYLPQEASIFRKLTVRDNILAVLELNKSLTTDQRNARAEKLMDDFSIGHLFDQIGQSLSGGERRRVEIARALASDPKFILLDEPFAGIDPIAVADTKRMITFLSKKGIGILITDHNVKDTLAICNRAYIVNEGKILYAGTTDEIIHNPQVKAVYLGEE